MKPTGAGRWQKAQWYHNAAISIDNVTFNGWEATELMAVASHVGDVSTPQGTTLNYLARSIDVLALVHTTFVSPEALAVGAGDPIFYAVWTGFALASLQGDGTPVGLPFNPWLTQHPIRDASLGAQDGAFETQRFDRFFDTRVSLIAKDDQSNVLAAAYHQPSGRRRVRLGVRLTDKHSLLSLSSARNANALDITPGGVIIYQQGELWYRVNFGR